MGGLPVLLSAITRCIKTAHASPPASMPSHMDTGGDEHVTELLHTGSTRGGSLKPSHIPGCRTRVLHSRLTCADGQPGSKQSVRLGPIAHIASQQQVGPFVKTALRKRNHVVNLCHNLPAESGVTVRTGPLVVLLPPSHNVTTGRAGGRLRRPTDRGGTDGTRHREYTGRSDSGHRAPNWRGSVGSYRHAATWCRCSAYHGSIRA